MYSTCLFCNQVLGSNQLIEAFPVGRRLAFDQRRGRLWVVCRKCEKWNLTPLEERWEAIETCERLFRDTRKRASTDNIGLARLPEGLELVRIGEPHRPEFAAWRYGDQFGRRRKRGILLGVGVGSIGLIPLAANVGYMVLGSGVLITVGTLVNLGLQVSQAGGMAYRKRKVLAGIPSTGGKKWLVRRAYVAGIRLVPSVSGHGWGLEIPCEEDGVKRRITLEGGDARRLAAKLVPTLTPDGGHRENVRSAVRKIEDQGDAEQYLNWLARNPFKWRDWSRRRDIVTGYRSPPGAVRDTLEVQGLETCLAVEMAVNEENERRALEGELALLALAWKDAEEIAAIADGLALPHGVETDLSRLRRETEAH